MDLITAPATFEPDVLGFGAAGTLGFIVEQRRRQDEAAARELRAVTHWADLHRVGQVGAVHPEIRDAIAKRGPLALDDVLGLEGELRLAGEGAFLVEEFAVAEVATALGMSEPAARGYVGQALELRDRLPRLWDRVQAGDLAAWKGRRIAEQTIPLNAAAAAYVDAQLAPFAAKVSLTRITAAVEAAVLRHDPDLAAERAEHAAERRGVWLEDHVDGTTAITAVTGTPDAHAFDAALDGVASTLGALGDTDPHQVRRAKGIGVLADPQYALDLTSTADASTEQRPKRNTQGPTIHVHLHTDAIGGITVGSGGEARVERFGARALETVQRWLADLAPGSSVKVTPVIDLNEHISSDAYEIPDRLRTQVTERDPGCMFPWCGRRGRFDLDHIEPFVPPDGGGPPGQTNTENLARLCRFHHRVKTHSSWSYRREPSGTLTWTSPLGRSYSVDETGTYPGD